MSEWEEDRCCICVDKKQRWICKIGYCDTNKEVG